MLPKTMRVQTQMFPSLLEKGSFLATSLFSLRFSQNKAKNMSFSVVVSKKVIKTAVGRNLLQRRVSEIIRSLLPLFKEKKAFQGIVFAKKGSEKLTFAQLSKEIEDLLRKTKLLLEK